jgi:hypothetical protein
MPHLQRCIGAIGDGAGDDDGAATAAGAAAAGMRQPNFVPQRRFQDRFAWIYGEEFTAAAKRNLGGWRHGLCRVRNHVPGREPTGHHGPGKRSNND